MALGYEYEYEEEESYDNEVDFISYKHTKSWAQIADKNAEQRTGSKNLTTISVTVKGAIKRGTLNNKQVIQYVVEGMVVRQNKYTGSYRQYDLGSDIYIVNPIDVSLSDSEFSEKLNLYREQSLEKFKAYFVMKSKELEDTSSFVFDSSSIEGSKIVNYFDSHSF